MNIPLAGLNVSEILTGFTATMRFGHDADFELQIEGDLELHMPGTTVGAESEAYDSVATELNELLGATVSAAEAADGVGLTIEFDSGTTLFVPIDEQYEAWGIVGPGGYRVICMPGGELAVWSAQT